MNNPIRLAAKGTVTAVGPVTKAKKAGGTYTVNEATLDTGVVITFGFDPAQVTVGQVVELEVVREYGQYKYRGPLNGQQLPDAFPPKAKPGATAPVAAPSPAKTQTSGSSYSPKVFPVPREHGDTAIIRQNALTNAVKTIVDGRFLDAENGRVASPTIEEATDAVIRIAYKYAAFSSGASDATFLAKLGSEPK